jgi:hypothetical protein
MTKTERERRKALPLLEVVVSWPGITREEAAEELQIKPMTAVCYAGILRDCGLVARGPVPTGLPPAFASESQKRIWAIVRQRYQRGQPTNKRAIMAHGFSAWVVDKSFQFLRETEAISPKATFWPTRRAIRSFTSPEAGADMLTRGGRSSKRSAADWWRVAASLPGWRLVDGVKATDPDDPAVAGCLLAMLGPRAAVHGPQSISGPPEPWRVEYRRGFDSFSDAYGTTLGRACIAAAEQIGRWPGGEE